MNRWAGPLITAAIVGGVALILFLNLETGRRQQADARAQAALASARPPKAEPQGAAPAAKPFREYPIGDEVERHGMRIAAVWLPAVHTEGMPESAGSGIIHLEADVKATADNPHGFALGEAVPYLKIQYEIAPTGGTPGEPTRGTLTPMVASDGLHYGANIAQPPPGRYLLTYALEPPSRGGLGRHDDRLTGVAPWWEPFRVGFEWDNAAPSPADSTGDRPPAGG